VRSGLPVGSTSTAQWSAVAQIVFFASLLNVGLFVFNMIPIPPLDGSVLFERLLPARYWPTYLKYRRYTMPILMGLVLLNFFLTQNGHVGPLTWLFDRLYSWWQNVLGV
jgi:Zn-dependent protease